VTTIVLDANVGLALVVPLSYSDRVQDLVEEWCEQEVAFVVPALWGYEVDSGLRKAVVSGVLTEAEAHAALQSLWALDIQEIPATLDRHTRALAWAKLLNQTVAYDAQYTVVAEELQAPLWTADRRLADAARSVGAEWVHWIGDRT
jgi:predicted nucleic acid-binding protein